ncbi:hypothetical protein VC83_05469 [Pseudogymnoascus destructans]|uniref:Uncharacterized protein n=1 Tax=Pseudogymnoascus destructans TaxID=655981 RepID=A0A177AA13_9PEZI|nr:uncharacterized protein VC83_05469 [Pseudogymnoascus destructans]OAF58023.1 hypothetical protein VC83_05469 [Pseudogymnoascus destructans]
MGATGSRGMSPGWDELQIGGGHLELSPIDRLLLSHWTATPMVERSREQFPDEVKASVSMVPMPRMMSVLDELTFLERLMTAYNVSI